LISNALKIEPKTLQHLNTILWVALTTPQPQRRTKNRAKSVVINPRIRSISRTSTAMHDIFVISIRHIGGII